jgi:NTP pyrophosphatase (non-canonical NTP hydrolase)
MSKPLTPRTIEYLEILQEECAELIQSVSKIKRFGVHSYNPSDVDKVTNVSNLITEMGDVIALITLLSSNTELAEEGVTMEFIKEAVANKLIKVPKYLRT